MPKPAKFPEDIQTLGQAVRYLREKQGLTLRGLAAAVKMSAPFLSDLEHDRRSTPRLAELAQALDVTEPELERFRMSSDLKDWLGQTPGLIDLLRDIRAAGTSTTELRSAFMKTSGQKTSAAKRKR